MPLEVVLAALWLVGTILFCLWAEPEATLFLLRLPYLAVRELWLGAARVWRGADGAMAARPDDDDPWMPYELEALGINDNERFIRETDGILNGLAWDSTKAGRDPLPKPPVGKGGGSPAPRHPTVVHCSDPVCPDLVVEPDGTSYYRPRPRRPPARKLYHPR